MVTEEYINPFILRSPPLVPRKSKKGEPKLLSTQKGKGKHPWKVVIYEDYKRKGKTFKKYRKAKGFAARLQMDHPTADVTVVSRQVGYGPPRTKISDEDLLRRNQRGELWCPYCRRFRDFLYSPPWGIDRCPVCSISIRDFHVRKNNPILQGKEY